MRNPEDAYKSKPDVSMPLFNKHLEQVRKDRENLDRICQIAHARRNDPETSKQAAASVTNAHSVRQAVVKIFMDHGRMVDEQLIEIYRVRIRKFGYPRATDSSIRSRRNELVIDGVLCNSGDFGKTASGRDSIVWRLAK